MNSPDYTGFLMAGGALASLLGIPLALWGIFQARAAARRSATEAVHSKNASIEARRKVEKFRGDLRLLSNVIDFERAVALMDDIKVFVRNANYSAAPERISSLVVLLNRLRSPSMNLGVRYESDIQASITSLRRIEDAIDKTIPPEEPVGATNFNLVISEQIDTLLPILQELRDRIGEDE